jgi:hypothetical protein
MTTSEASGYTIEQVRALPAVVDLWPTAAAALGIKSRSVAFDLARRQALPVPVLHVGRRVKVATAALLRVLDPPQDETPPARAGSSPTPA